ncbi:MAG: DUF167 domain-containing protein [Deltaproteobacteria bacterium]|jgi:uncharacterized protein (TIGR00251 family)|nr:DUF167 domain-containing protein [Deltaproteobacteria bacterium]
MSGLKLSKKKKELKSARVTVRLTPRSSRNRLSGWDGQSLKITLTAPPVEGEANKSLIKFLAKALALKAGDITIVSGISSRQKILEIIGLNQEELTEILNKMAAQERSS